jgi:hypothetical protein
LAKAASVPARGLRRGTIGLFGSAAPLEMLPTFRWACVYQPVYLQVYFRELSRKGFPVTEECFRSEYHRYLGDFLETGKGEILFRDGASSAK